MVVVAVAVVVVVPGGGRALHGLQGALVDGHGEQLLLLARDGVVDALDPEGDGPDRVCREGQH